MTLKNMKIGTGHVTILNIYHDISLISSSEMLGLNKNFHNIFDHIQFLHIEST